MLTLSVSGSACVGAEGGEACASGSIEISETWEGVGEDGVGSESCVCAGASGWIYEGERDT